MKKVVKDGMVAVLFSPGYGAGWSTWNREHPDMVFDPGMIDLVLANETEKANTYASLKWTDAYLGGIDQLTVRWIPENSRFIIDEYDGFESVMLADEYQWLVA